MALLALLFFLSALLPDPTASQANNTALPLTLSPRVLTGTEQTCPPHALRQSSLAETAQDIRTLLRDNITCPAARTQTSPAASCSAISTSCPSGKYWVRSSNGSAVQVYCDMHRVCGCNRTGGWARIAYLNTTDTSQQCPSAWRLITTPRRTCGRSTDAASCDSAIFPSNGIRYSHICGRVTGYQDQSPDAFRNIRPLSTNIDNYYLDGVSVTHGTPGSRQHIWSFAASAGINSCPCNGGAGAPSYIGQDYFCETGNDNGARAQWLGTFFGDDPLWDGQDCGRGHACECTLNNPPWFCKQLPQATTDDIEVRICGDQSLSDEDSPVELVELYIR